MPQLPSFKEDDISQLPALVLLQNMGYEYLSPEEAEKQRGGKLSNVLLEGILEDKLKEINRIRTKDREYAFIDANIRTAIQALREVPFDGLIRTNERIYDLLCLGKALEQSIGGVTKSYNFQFIDWENPQNNAFHVSDEFEVKRRGMDEVYRPDIVLFVNGIPLAVIECKRPDIKDSLSQAISQHIRSQNEDGIVGLYGFSQIVGAVNKNELRYGTTGTGERFWAEWKEKEDTEKEIERMVQRPLPPAKKDVFFQGKYRYARQDFESTERAGGRQATGQDRGLHSLFRPERLLELTFRYVVFDAGVKKIARYQQYFAVRRIVERIAPQGTDGKRQGGVVWHTQGSGKSLAMVMLAKAISLDPRFPDHRIVIVTDRIDLDDQIWKTFHRCHKEPERARTGNNLVELVVGKNEIITTVIHKFESAVKRQKLADSSPNIFVLVDESHRTQYGEFHTMMHKVFPNACFLGFTGTPIMKQHKNTVAKFGGLIDSYTIDEAVADKAVVPLLYEGRHVEQIVNRDAIDTYFNRVCEPLTEHQTGDLKKKFAQSDQIMNTEQRLREIAWDVSAHYAEHWQGTGFKAQITADRKLSAIKLKKYFDEIGKVRTEVVISPPDEREGHLEVDEESDDEVVAFWKKQMARFGTDKKCSEAIRNQFLYDDEPEILIVVDMLLTGFDAPRNTVLYINRKLEGHNLLQAIARVNRIYPGKDYGYIVDYYGLLGELDQALNTYGSLQDFDNADLHGCLMSIEEEVKKLPQRHSDLWDVFKEIRQKWDEEEYERLLADEAKREQFYMRLSQYARNLDIALSTVKFVRETSEGRVQTYKLDLRFFSKLRLSVRRRYAEAVDYREYERKIQKLLDTHIVSDKVERITPLVNIFDKEAFREEVAKIDGTAAKADAIAHRTMKTIHERMDEDPAFYKKFSKLLEEIIEAFRQRRIDELQYLKKVQEYLVAVQDRTTEGIPEKLREKEHARAYYGSLKEMFENAGVAESIREPLAIEGALRIDQIIGRNAVVDWHSKRDIQNKMVNEIEDFLFEMKGEYGVELDFTQMDAIIEEAMKIARSRVK